MKTSYTIPAPDSLDAVIEVCGEPENAWYAWSQHRHFPILDWGQLGLPAETKSTITQDRVLAAMAKRTGSRPAIWSRRAVEARALGYVLCPMPR